MSHVTLAAHAMATRFEFVLAGGEPTFLRAVGQEALDAIHDWESRLSRFRPDSLVSILNRDAARRPVVVDPQMMRLFRLCRDVWEASGGAFDPTVGPLMQAWGFRPGERRPTVAEASAVVGMHLVHLDDRALTVRFERHGVSIDLGAIGKGWALDAAAEIIRAHGRRALLHGGTSSVVAIGPAEGGEPFRIALPGDGAPTVLLRDATLSVSERAGRTAEVDGRRVGHVLDPRTGRPVDGATLAAVVCPSAALGDAWSTALLVANERPPTMPGDWATILRTDSRWVVEGGERVILPDPPG